MVQGVDVRTINDGTSFTKKKVETVVESKTTSKTPGKEMSGGSWADDLPDGDQNQEETVAPPKGKEVLERSNNVAGAPNKCLHCGSLNPRYPK